MSKPIYQILKDVDIKRSTLKAHLINYKGRNIWLPFSLINNIYPNLVSNTYTIIVPFWYAEKNGLIYINF